MNEKIRRIISKLGEAVSRTQAPPTPELDLQLRDQGSNIYDYLLNDQNMYFFGSKGSGKTTIIEVRKDAVLADNRKLENKTLPCVINCAKLFASREKAIAEHDRQRITQRIYWNLIRQLYPHIGFERQKWISSIYVWLRKLNYNWSWNKRIGRVYTPKNQNTIEQEQIKTSRFRLGFTSDIASVGFSLLQAGPISLGAFKFVPISVNLEHEKEQQSAGVSVQGHQAVDKREENAIQYMVAEIARACKESKIAKIVFLIDDLHDLPLKSQVKLVDILLNTIDLFDTYKVKVVFKLFSATDLSGDISEAIGLDKEWEVVNMQSSLEVVDAKITSLEIFLEQILLQEFTKQEIHELFPRNLTEQISILSGGHPRRFIRICKNLLEKTEGNLDNMFSDLLLLAASEVINESRRKLIIQLGIETDPHALKYSSWYDQTIQKLVDYITDKSPTQAFFLIPQSKLRNNRELEQWIRDAVVIGDILDISKDLKLSQNEYCRLLALNPATIYDLKDKTKFILTYEHVKELQTGAKQTIASNVRILSAISKG